MNKFMKRLAKNEGFTLVELIVVIAILAILAGVATAGYASYIKRANNSAVQSELENLSSATVIANAIAGEIDNIKVATKDENNITVTIDADVFAPDFVSDFIASYGDVTLTAVKDSNDKTVGYTFDIPKFSSWDSSDYADINISHMADGVDWTGSWENPKKAPASSTEPSTEAGA